MNAKHLIFFSFFSTIIFTIYTMEQHKRLKQGVLIAFEGIDDSIKTVLTQSVNILLVNNGYNTELKKSDDFDLGKQINTSSKIDFERFAANQEKCFTENIIPILKHKKFIIYNRLAGSSLVYQGYNCGFDLETIKKAIGHTIKQATPDITIFIKVPAQMAIQRCENYQSFSSPTQKEFLEKVAQGFEDIINDPTCVNPDNVIVVDQTKHPMEDTKQPHTIASEIYDKLIMWIIKKKLLLSNLSYSKNH